MVNLARVSRGVSLDLFLIWRHKLNCMPAWRWMLSSLWPQIRNSPAPLRTRSWNEWYLVFSEFWRLQKVNFWRKKGAYNMFRKWTRVPTLFPGLLTELSGWGGGGKRRPWHRPVDSCLWLAPWKFISFYLKSKMCILPRKKLGAR